MDIEEIRKLLRRKAVRFAAELAPVYAVLRISWGKVDSLDTSPPTEEEIRAFLYELIANLDPTTGKNPVSGAGCEVGLDGDLPYLAFNYKDTFWSGPALNGWSQDMIRRQDLKRLRKAEAIWSKALLAEEVADDVV